MTKEKRFSCILMIFLLMTLSFTLKSHLDCSKIKTGRFYYYSKISRDKVDIVRTDSMQLETNTKNGHVLKNKIYWKGDCTYDMYINALSDFKLGKMDSLLATIPAAIEIINVGPEFYVCMWNMKVLNKKMSGTDTIYFKKAN